jgi:uncharacterized membrane protein YhaH (DUF805 family)
MKKSFQIFKNVMTNHYMNFNGRVSRPGYWHFVLWTVIISIPLIALDFVVFGIEDEDLTLFSSLWELAVLIPSIGLAIRRFHDTNRTGWWVLIPYIALIPTIIFFVLEFESLGIISIVAFFIILLASLVFLCQKSDPEANQYGDPVHLG